MIIAFFKHVFDLVFEMVVEIPSQDKPQKQQLRQGDAVPLLGGCKSRLWKRQVKKGCCNNDFCNGSKMFHT
jgi:hypothetical protein